MTLDPLTDSIAADSIAAGSIAADLAIAPPPTLPILDLAPLFPATAFNLDESARAACVEQIKQAVLTVGCFGARGTGISQQLIERVYQQSAAFHQLADQVKRPLLSRNRTPSRGWIPLHQEPAYEPGTIAHVEGFDLGLHLSPDDPDFLPASPLLGANVYPDLPGFQADVEAYYTQADQVGQGLLQAIAELLGLERHTFSRLHTRRAGSSMRLLHYPGNTQPIEDSNIGISAHSDFEMLTLLHQTAPGLQLMSRDGHWLNAPVIPDGLMVILDDGLEFLTNGVLKATRHRVPLTHWERYSIILFHAADVDQVLAPLPAFVSPDRPAQYPPVTQADHILQQVNSGLENLNAVASPPAPALNRVTSSAGKGT
ncbi:MAG TPA: 2OG-Fe(II) oxygenase family protein [Coleofasciculaceae cyanobacterium]